ncbi:glycine zipper family protein [Geomesophilobacter sediminis]|uniref:YMGG-like Gly-zipper domain-containing protein n=1 Tax=Geomesophilobacter sediminis TaxID=2798584 RepID=A0A8J7JKE0_9BACT|nr:glycine zipper family protein [Geomesophilobacter sediminis]MBJ6724920.1 hypothetical protein [Geomesophilobacter sediminis]
MKMLKYTAVVVVTTLTLGCVGMTRQQQSTLSGGAMGAAGGAFLGAISGGSPAVGAAVGGAAGALTGFILSDPGDRRYYRHR